jgi:hypothetical protein
MQHNGRCQQLRQGRGVCMYGVCICACMYVDELEH